LLTHSFFGNVGKSGKGSASEHGIIFLVHLQGNVQTSLARWPKIQGIMHF